ncbi:MAG: hypothetical protein J5487_01685 [Lachnospiraceae bacterium]|nr:hypothetical protein [Lachnospiraceae bacterium]
MSKDTFDYNEETSTKSPNSLKTLITVLIGCNIALMLAVVGFIIFIMAKRNDKARETTASSAYETSVVESKTEAPNTQSKEIHEEEATTVTVTYASETDSEYDTKENDEKKLQIACTCLDEGDFQKAISALNGIKDEEILGNYLVHAKACAQVRGNLLILDTDAADTAFNYVDEELPGADVIKREYDSIKVAKEAVDSNDYELAVSMYEYLGGSYAGLIMDTYKDEADYYISHREYEKAGPALLKIMNDPEYLAMHYYEIVVEEDSDGETGYLVGKELFKNARQYWDGQVCVFALYYHDMNDEPGGFHYRFVSGNKYVFCTYDMTGTYKDRLGNY